MPPNFSSNSIHSAQSLRQVNEYDQGSSQQSFGFSILNPHAARYPIVNQGNQMCDSEDSMNQRARFIGTNSNGEVNREDTIGYNNLNQNFLENSSAFLFAKANLMKPETYKEFQTNGLYPADNPNPKKWEFQNVENRPCQLNSQIKVEALNEDSCFKPNVKLEKPSCEKSPENLKSRNNNDSDPQSLQNLKAIAKTVYEGIKQAKVISYVQISNKLFQQLVNERLIASQAHEKSDILMTHAEKNKTKIVNEMIDKQSFEAIKELNAISSDIQGSVADVQIEQISNDSINQKTTKKSIFKEHPHQNNLKNIRRRLYDAINVMLASKIIMKNKQGLLSLQASRDCYRGDQIQKNTPKKGKRSKTDGSQCKTESNECKSNGKLNFGDFEQFQNRIASQQRSIEGKKKYLEYMISKYISLKKHIKLNQKKDSEKGPGKVSCPETQMSFPLIMTGLEGSSEIEITCNGKDSKVKIEAADSQSLDLVCDLDIVGSLYWVQNDQIQHEKEKLLSRLKAKTISPASARTSQQVSDYQPQDEDLDNLKKKVKTQQFFFE